MDLGQDGASCLFADISSFFRDELTVPGGLIDELKKNPAMAIETLAPLMAKGMLVKRRAWCVRHQMLGCISGLCTFQPFSIRTIIWRLTCAC